VIGGQRVFASAFAALERLHETGVFMHNAFCCGQKNAPSHCEKRLQIACSSHLFRREQEPLACVSWNWHLARAVALPPVAVVSSGQSLHHSE
jgi:hypothetical protein